MNKKDQTAVLIGLFFDELSIAIYFLSGVPDLGFSAGIGFVAGFGISLLLASSFFMAA